MKIDATKHFIKDIKQLKKNDPAVFKAVQKKIKSITWKSVKPEQLKWYDNIYKTRIWKYRMAYTFKWNELLLLIIIRKREVVYKDLKRIIKNFSN